MYDAGTAMLTVVPSFRGVEQAIRRQATGWGTSAGQQFNKALTTAASRAQVGPSRQHAQRQGAGTGDAYADGFRRRVESALKALPPVTIGVARNEAEQQLKDLQSELRALNSRRVGVDIDAAEALAQVERIQQRLNELGRTSPDVQVRADTAAAAAQLAAVGAQARRLSTANPTINVDVDAAGAVAGMAGLGAAASRSIGPMSVLVAVGATLGPAIVPAAAAAAAAVASIGPAAVAGAVGIGVAVLGFAGIADAVKALDGAQEDAGRSASQLAQRQAQVASAVDRVRSAERALANTRASNAEAARRAGEAVVRAQRGVEQAAGDVTRAERQVARAQEDAKRAALDLARAREEERRASQDLAFDLEGVGYAQRRAMLDLADAKEHLDRMLANPRATEAQREAAEVAYREIDLRVRQLAVQHERLTDEQQRSAKAGVGGSQRVIDAQRRLRDATQAVADAQQGVVDAHRRVAEAQAAVGEAMRAQAEQQRQAAYALANAQQSVVSAQRSLEQATVSAGEAGSASMRKLEEAMDGLSPAGQRFARFIFGLKDELGSLRASAAEALLPGVQKAIENLLPALPRVRDFVASIGQVLGDVAVRASEALGGPAWSKFFDMIGRAGPPLLERMLTATGNLMLGFANLAVAFEPFTEDMIDGLVDLTERFAAWSASLDDSPGFQRFLDWVREMGPIAMDFFGDLLIIVGKLMVALAPFGELVLKGLGWLADALADLDPGVLLYIAAAVTAVVGGVIALAAGPVAAIGVFIAAIMAVVGVIVYAYNKVSWFRTIVDTVFGAIATTATWLWKSVFVPAWNGIAEAAQWAWENVIRPVFNAITWVVEKVLAPIFTWLYRNVITPVWQGIQLAVSVAWAAIKVVFGLIQIYIKAVLAPLFTWLYKTIIKPAWDGISNAVKWVWENVLKPIFTSLGNFIKNEVAPNFKRGVEAVGRAWDAIREAAKAPVKFVVETVLNNGILAGYNRIAKAFGVKPDDVKIPLPKGFAAGGVLPGYTPGRDTHRFVSPTGGVLDLSGGEAILRPEGTRVLGADWVHGINAAARAGGTAGVARWLGGYADGGILDKLGGVFAAAKRKATDVITGVGDLLRDPAGAMRRMAERLMATLPGRDTMFGKAVLGLPSRVIGVLVDKVRGLFQSDDRGPAPAGGLGWQRMTQIIRAAFPGLPIYSSYRPGSVTLSGERDYHSVGRALDLPPRWDVFNWIRSHFPNSRELIFTPAGGMQIWNGRPHLFTGAGLQAQHMDHVHWAYDSGGMLPPGLSTVYNGTGRPEPVLTGGQWDSLRALARARHAEPSQTHFHFKQATLDQGRLAALMQRRDILARIGRPD